MQQVSIIGPNTAECSKELYEFGVELGKRIASPQRVFFCGGHGGFMEAVYKGIKQASGSFRGNTIGILPEDTREKANPFIDVFIPTGMGIARNVLIINCADIVIAAGGGAGTLSELAFAWQKRKKTICITSYGGWAKELGGKNLDNRVKELFIPVISIEDVLVQLNNG